MLDSKSTRYQRYKYKDKIGVGFLSSNSSSVGSSDDVITDAGYQLDLASLLFVNLDPTIRYLQVGLAFYGLFETYFYFVLTYNGNLLEKLTNVYFVVELLCTIPWIVEIFVPEANNIFIPVFLNCWIVKRNLNYIFKDFNNLNTKNDNSVISQHLISLATLLVCLIFTSLCGFQHLQRSDPMNQITLFDAMYYIIITFSTVGYGDIVASSWPSKLFMMFMIIIALIVIPTQLEHLASLWFEKQNLGGSYHRSQYVQHIVVCSTHLQYDLIIDFLKEFYAHRKNQGICTVLLSTSELDIQLKGLLHTPLWKQRVFYIHGSVLRDTDLERAKVTQAKAVFVLASRDINDKNLSDQHTILRSWAIKDFAPNTPQFVQLFHPENAIHIKFADHLVCEDEFKYALLANNCLCPGISTLITLLLHKSAKEFEYDAEEWHSLYGKLAGNEIHSIVTEGSKFFHEFIGKSFTHASVLTHRRYGVCLMGIGIVKDQQSSTEYYFDPDKPFPATATKSKLNLKSTQSNTTSSTSSSNLQILLNPGNDYRINAKDICFYISLTKEENFDVKLGRKSFIVEEFYNQNVLVSGPDLSLRAINKAKSTDNEKSDELDAQASDFSENVESLEALNSRKIENVLSVSKYDVNDNDLFIGSPPNPLYIGSLPSTCKLLKTPKQLCCLELNGDCTHKAYAHASEYHWKNKCIILASESATNGLFNFILPLRGKVRSTEFLRPIVLLLQTRPSVDFLEAICHFPLIFWIQGTISNISNLLKAGIMDSDLIVISKEKCEHLEDESLSDCSNIIAVQNIHRLFPTTKVVAELTKASNIRFMKFRAKEMDKEKSANMGYMYRHPFAAGNVFSASMIDTLLYQTFGKPYLIQLIRILIGLCQSDGSGNLTSIPLTEDDMWIRTYGNLYKKLTVTTGEIPIGLYRTERQDVDTNDPRKPKHQVEQLIVTTMHKLGIDPKKYNTIPKTNTENISYVLINPSNDFQLKNGDIIYLLKPGYYVQQQQHGNSTHTASTTTTTSFKNDINV